MKQRKILLFLGMLCLLGLTVTSCMSGGSQPAQGWSGVASGDDALYMGSMGGEMVSVDTETRTLVWTHAFSSVSSGGFMSCGQTSSPVAIYGTPVATEDLVYIGIYSGKIYALNAATGQVRWAYPKEGSIGPVVGSPVVVGDVVYVSSSDGRVYALDTTYGELKWKSEVLDEKLWTPPLVTLDAIYVSTFDGHIYSLSPDDGSLLPWVFKSDVGFVSAPVFSHGIVAVGLFDNSLCAVKAGGSAPEWSFLGDSWFWAAPVVEDGIVYAACLDGKIYALNAETGEMVWEFDSQEPIVASPVCEGDLLLVVNESGNMYVFDTNARPADKNMKPIKTISVEAEVKGALCVHEGIVYVRGQNNVLYALDIDKGMIDWQLSLAVE
ncbi:MAG: PQQ-binding-like beta-propeller repeat protein [Dehalococcoidia bacterium]|nr:PQQ-binding-like beta-propeller repeat protein [Dehalococcoidia bacterium]